MKLYLTICLLLLSFSAYGALTKWVDADGKVQYSDGPPPTNAKAKKLTTHSASGVEASQTYVEREAELKKAQKIKEEAEQKAARQQEEALTRQKKCAALRSNLTALEKSRRIATYNDKGESVLMDDATRRQQIEEVRSQISAACD